MIRYGKQELELMENAIKAANKIDLYKQETLFIVRGELEKLRLFRERNGLPQS